MKPKRDKHTIKFDKQEKQRDKEGRAGAKWLEDYMDCFTFKLLPMTDAGIERIAIGLVSYVKDNPDVLKISEFFNFKGISRATYYRWFAKYEKMKHAKEVALSILADRRERGAVTRKFDSATINAMMPMYDPEWKDMVEWRSKLKAESQENSGPKIVVLESFQKPEEKQ